MFQDLHIFKYLNINRQNDPNFDPMNHDVKSNKGTGGNIYAMKYLCVDTIEYIPLNAPKPRGQAIQTNCFVYSYHASDKISRKSQIGILLYFNYPSFLWY